MAAKVDLEVGIVVSRFRGSIWLMTFFVCRFLSLPLGAVFHHFYLCSRLWLHCVPMVDPREFKLENVSERPGISVALNVFTHGHPWATGAQ